MKALLQSLARSVFGLLLVSGVATAAVATNAQPAQAGVVVSVGIGVGYGPAYHRYYRGAYYRHYGPPVWVAPVVYGPPPAYGYFGPLGFRRPYYYGRYHYGYGHGYGYRYGRGGYGYGRGYGGHRFYR